MTNAMTIYENDRARVTDLANGLRTLSRGSNGGGRKRGSTFWPENELSLGSAGSVAFREVTYHLQIASFSNTKPSRRLLFPTFCRLKFFPFDFIPQRYIRTPLSWRMICNYFNGFFCRRVFSICVIPIVHIDGHLPLRFCEDNRGSFFFHHGEIF